MKRNFKDKLQTIYGNINKSNKGSTLITVIVVVGFMSILATVLLYIVGENYKTKIYDLKTKESFYEAEEIIERFKATLVRDVAESSKPAYDSVVMNFSQSIGENGSVELNAKKIRETEYLTVFHDEITNRINARRLDASNNCTIEQIITGFIPESFTLYPDDGYYHIKINGNELKYRLDTDLSNFFDPNAVTSENVYGDDGQLASYMINDVKITVIDDATGYVSVISTSFQITPPQLNWGDELDNKDLDFRDCVKYYNYKKE